VTRLTTLIPAVVESPARLPGGYALVPLTSEGGGPVQVCAVVRSEGGKSPAEGGPLIVLREGLDARVYLGCLADAAGRVHRWLEIWVQDVSGLGAAPAAVRDGLTNAQLDARWAQRCDLADKAGSAFGASGLVRCGWETTPPAPIWINPRTLKVVPAKDAQTGGTWMLCRDENVLTQQGLPGYAGTLSRSVYQPELGAGSPVLPAEGLDARALGLPPECVPLNACGGLMMVQPYAPLSYEQFIDMVSGAPSAGHGGEGLLKLLAAASGAGATDSATQWNVKGGWLNLAGVGVRERLPEALHLKVMVLSGAVNSVRAFAQATQTPLLGLSADSFRVRLADQSGALPSWWTARAVLADAGWASSLPIEGAQGRYFVSARGGMSIYSPSAMSRSASGKGLMRLRNVLTQGTDGPILEGTLLTQERVSAGAGDLLWLRFGVGGTRLDLYASLDTQQAMASGELRLRTLPKRLSDDVQQRLKAALGVPIPDVQFELVPLLSTPCDLYALGVLAVRTLLVGQSRALPIALDEVLSLAFEAARLKDSGEELPRRIERVFSSDPRWSRALGPQHLVHDAIEPEDALAAVPLELWARTLACVVRMMTGISPDSRCSDVGDSPLGGVHRVFDAVLDDLYALMVGCRGLIVSDAAASVEVRKAIRSCLAGLKS
jgi:hypothetical protein